MRRYRSSARLLFAVAFLVAGLVALARTNIIPTPRQAIQGGPELVVAVLDVGQAESIVIRAPSGRTMLVDAGNNARDAREVILPYLAAQGISHLDVVVLTHPDQDHVGGLPEVFQSISVGRFVDSAQASSNRAYERALELALSRRIPSERARFPTTSIDLGPGVAARVLAPQEPLLETGDSTENNNSVVLRLQIGQTAIMLTGDIEREGEARLLKTGERLLSQVLKVAHHGSRTSTTPAFLDAVQPEVAIISVGANNPYGHPHRQTLDALGRRGVTIHRTDQQGTITARLRADGYVIEPARP